MKKSLFIPGPVNVRKEILEKMAKPVIGHRTKEFSTLYGSVISGLRKLMYTDSNVYLSATSATGIMEAAVRNCVKDRCLNIVNGAFSSRWHDITVSCGKDCDKLEVEWGKVPTAEMMDEKLSEGSYDSLTLVHNETSTGVIAPLDDISKVAKKHDVLLLVDTVSSMGGTKIEVDKLGIDVCLFGTQKAMALPPGMAFCSVSDRALKVSEGAENKGYYLDFLVWEKYAKKSNTHVTPPINLMYAVNAQLDYIINTEGRENRFQRHERMAEIARSWTKKNFELFAEEKCCSNTITCVKNSKNIDVQSLSDKLFESGYVFSNGYGKLKNSTFRLAHMGDTQVDDLKEYLDEIDHILGL